MIEAIYNQVGGLEVGSFHTAPTRAPISPQFLMEDYPPTNYPPVKTSDVTEDVILVPGLAFVASSARASFKIPEGHLLLGVKTTGWRTNVEPQKELFVDYCPL